MLVELGVVEPRYDAVKETLDGGATVTEVAERLGVTRQSLHKHAPALSGARARRVGRRSRRPKGRCPHRTVKATGNFSSRRTACPSGAVRSEIGGACVATRVALRAPCVGRERRYWLTEVTR